MGEVVSGIFGMEAADEQAEGVRDAADSAASAARYGADLQKQIFDQTRTDAEPWRTAGTNALKSLVSRETPLTRGFLMSDFQADPGYQFRRSEGLRGMEQRAAAGGGLRSGNTLKALMDYGQNMASNEYGAAYNRFRDTQGTQRNYLQSLAGVGQTANQQIGSAGQTYANNAGNLMMTNAANQGNAAMALGNARAGSYQAIGNSLGSAFASPTVQNTLSNWWNGGSNGFGTVGSGGSSFDWQATPNIWE